MPRSFQVAFTAFALLVSIKSTASAVPIQISAGQFSPEAIAVNFVAGVDPDIPGVVTFGGGETFTVGAVWGASSPPYDNLLFDDLWIIFTQPVRRVGFTFGSNAPSTTPLALGIGGTTVGDLGTITGQFVVQNAQQWHLPPDGINNWVFYGFDDPGGIQTLFFGPELNAQWFVGIGQLIYEPLQVPEASTLQLASMALGLALVWQRGRSKRALRRTNLVQ